MKNVNDSVMESSTDTKASNKFFIRDNGEDLYFVHTMDNINGTNVGTDKETAIENAISWLEYCLDSEQTDNIHTSTLCDENGTYSANVMKLYLEEKYDWNDVSIEGDNITIKYNRNIVAIINNEDSECVGVEIYLCNGDFDFIVNDACCSFDNLDEAIEFVVSFDINQ